MQKKDMGSEWDYRENGADHVFFYRTTNRMTEQENIAMKWTISCDDRINVLQAAVSGHLTVHGILALAAELLDKSQKTGIRRCICDCRGASLDLRFSDIYHIPRQLSELGVDSGHIVVVVYPLTRIVAPFFAYFGSCAVKAGLSHKSFSDYDQALLWLEENNGTFMPNASYRSEMGSM
jgi:hypothetical protein